MKFSNFGQVLLASVVSFVLCFGLISCAADYTVGYLYVSSAQYNQVQGFKIDNNRGKLNPVSKGIKASGGTNPVRMLILPGGRFLYVLNTGCGNVGQAVCNTSGGPQTVSGNITVFSIGGYGQISPQQSFSTQGINPIRMQADASGRYLYVLDKTAPDGSGNGDITVFAIDSNTGRLALVTNSQTIDKNGTNLTYFPVGKLPVDMKLVGGYLFTVDSADQTVFPYQVNTGTGQLTVAQSGPQSTGAGNISVIASGGNYLYLLDAGFVPSHILPYTIGSNGSLQAVVGGTVVNSSPVPNPTALLLESKGKFLYVTNGGPSSGLNTPNGDISAYSVQSNGTLVALSPAPGTDFNTGSGPECLVEDPSNQFLYTANFNDGTVTGRQIDTSAGLLNPLHAGTPSSYTTAGQPTSCVSINN